jgi:tRNA (guanine6-N2)-methyltransferase
VGSRQRLAGCAVAGYDWFATTVPGLEDVAAEELGELLGVSAVAEVGRVFFRAGLEAMYLVNFASRTVNRLFLQLARVRVSGLWDVYRAARSVSYVGVIPPGRSFAVRSERVGEHGFTSLDVSRAVGQAVIDSYVEETGVRPRVDLDNPDVEVWAYLRGDELLLGVNTTGESLHKRRYRVYDHPAALKPTIAHAMLRIAGYRGQPLVDPLCGGGTIPIEAAHHARRLPILLFRSDYLFRGLGIHDPQLEEEVRGRLLERANDGVYPIACVDVSPKHLRGAEANAENARVRDTIVFRLGDSTRPETYAGLDAELVVTNPPYGIRSHRLEKIGVFYESLLRTLRDVYPGRLLVAITSSTRQLADAVARAGAEVVGSRRVMHGKLQAQIYKIRL